jgi:hypothetical protein
MSENWYTRVDADTPLTQGDLISDCPLIGWDDRDVNVSGADEAEVLKGVSKAIRADVVVMTQACDLENRKVANGFYVPMCLLRSLKKVGTKPWMKPDKPRHPELGKAIVTILETVLSGI